MATGRVAGGGVGNGKSGVATPNPQLAQMATGNWRVATLSHRGELAKMFYYRLSTRSLAICITKFHIIRVLCPVIFAITRLASFLSRLPPLNTYDWAPRRAASKQIPENVFNFQVLPHNSSAPCLHSSVCWSFN